MRAERLSIRTMHWQMQRIRRRLPVALALAGSFWAVHAQAQHGEPVPSGAASADVSFITGQDFAGLRLGQSSVKGSIAFSARRANVWRQGTTQRLHLSGDVRVSLGDYDFSASRAVAWVERLPEDQAGLATYQVFIYFDRVGAPNDAAGSISVSGDRLPVRAVVATEKRISLRADLLESSPPARAETALLFEAERAFARTLRRLVPGYIEETPPPISRGPRLPGRLRPGDPIEPDIARPFAASRSAESVAEAEQLLDPVRIPAADEPIFARSGIVSLSAGEITFVTGEKENSVIAKGGVSLMYQDVRTGRALQLTAQRAVLFISPGRVTDFSRFKKSDTRGVYLEGEVSATDGQYTLRGPKVYYDLIANKAVVLDAVFWTYDEERKLPLYVRADAIRQESADQFRATGAKFSNSAFFEPEFSIGASSVTISRKQAEPTEEQAASGRPGTIRNYVTARNITLRAGPVPFFYWPIYAGDPANVPLRDVRVENSSGSGGAIKTRWNASGLLGFAKPDDLVTDLQLDYYFDRGFGIGGRVAWDRAGSKGGIFAYGLPNDQGKDVLKTGFKKQRDGEARGMILGEERWMIDEHWTLLAEASYISDENFVDGLFKSLSEERREFTSRVEANRRFENTLLRAEVSGSLNDFISNGYLLQSRGYSVSKLPEVSYSRLADEIIPGVFSYWSESRAGIISMDFDDPLAIDRGFGNRNARKAFGIDADQSIASRLRQRGYTETQVARFDTRHEASSQLRYGQININPFAVGRLTAYDNNFEDYSPAEDDDIRMWGGGGVRLATSVQRVMDGVDSRLLDLHRLRHIVEPSFTIFYSATNVERADLPLYDYDVESLAEGPIMRLGVNQTWQTQRGGPGRWHSVDVFKLNTDVVLSSDDADPKTPIGRYIEYRPELSNPGDYFLTDAVWQLSDTLAITGSNVFDFERNQPARTSAGFMIRHEPNFRSFADLHFLNSQDSTVINIGTQYEFTSKYALAASTSYDAGKGGIQGANFELRRKFENLQLGFNINYNEITGESSFGFVLRPYGAAGEVRVAGLGSDDGIAGSGGR